MQVLKINKRDEVLTLSSGGCNSLNLLLHGAGHVVSVDCNPAQSALLELKATAIRSVPPVASVQAPKSSGMPCISPLVLFGLADLTCQIVLHWPEAPSCLLKLFKHFKGISAKCCCVSQQPNVTLPWCIGLGDQLHLANLCSQPFACGYLIAQGSIG